MKLGTGLGFLAVGAACVVIFGAAGETPAKKPSFVLNLTAGPEDLHSAWMGLRLAEHAVNDGRAAIVFLNVGAARFAAKDTAARAKFESHPSVAEQLTALMEKGTRVIVCPECAAHAGVAEDAFLPGIEMASREKLFGELDASTVVFSY
jgi:predicted peroxiredoxin